MHAEIQPRVALNGRLLAADEVKISPFGEGFMQGRGLFETVKVLGGRPVFFRDHFERLRRSAAVLGLPWSSSLEQLLERCAHVIAANNLGEGNLKLVVFQDADAPGELILARTGTYAAEHYARGFALTSVPGGGRPGIFSGLKTLNYLENSAAKRRAQAAGFDESVFVHPDGSVLEGATSNVFAVRQGAVCTPSLDSGILPGVARANVLRLRSIAPMREENLPVSDLLEAEEVFVTNALLGVMPVARIDRRTYDLSHNPVTRALQSAYRAAELLSVQRLSPQP